jgi:Flp pilus assembly protein TadD
MKLPSKLAPLCCCLAIAVVCWIALPSATADETSQALIQRGAVELGRGKPAEALAHFQNATQTDPQDGDAHFLAGVALNRLGRHAEALKSLQQAERLKTEYRDLYFELGWAYLFTRQYQRAVESLTHYEKIKPGRAVAQELLGRAHLGLNQDDEAEAAFREALQRDARLAPTCNYYLGAIALRRGEREKAAQLLNELVRQQPTTAIGQSARSLLEAYRADGRRWSIALGAALGYDSNVIQLDPSQPLPPDVSKRHARSAQWSVAVAYDLMRQRDDLVSAAWELSGSFFDGISSFDTIDNRLALWWRHRVDERLSWNAGVDNRYSEIGGDAQSYDLTFPLSLDLRLNQWLVVRPSYAFAYSQNFLAVASALDRDGTAHTLGVTAFLRPANARLTARIGLSHRWSDTDGGDYDLESDTFSAGFNLPLPQRATLDVSYSRIRERYDNPNSFSGFTARRRDDVDIVRVELAKALDARWLLQAAFNHVRDNSNLPTFDYKRHTWTLGVTFRY